MPVVILEMAYELGRTAVFPQYPPTSFQAQTDGYPTSEWEGHTPSGPFVGGYFPDQHYTKLEEPNAEYHESEERMFPELREWRDLPCLILFVVHMLGIGVFLF